MAGCRSGQWLHLWLFARPHEDKQRVVHADCEVLLLLGLMWQLCCWSHVRPSSMTSPSACIACCLAGEWGKPGPSWWQQLQAGNVTAAAPCCSMLQCPTVPARLELSAQGGSEKSTQPLLCAVCNARCKGEPVMCHLIVDLKAGPCGWLCRHPCRCAIPEAPPLCAPCRPVAMLTGQSWRLSVPLQLCPHNKLWRPCTCL